MSARKVQAAAAAKSAGAGGMSVEEKCLTMMRPGELFSMDEDMRIALFEMVKDGSLTIEEAHAEVKRTQPKQFNAKYLGCTSGVAPTLKATLTVAQGEAVVAAAYTRLKSLKLTPIKTKLHCSTIGLKLVAESASGETEEILENDPIAQIAYVAIHPSDKKRVVYVASYSRLGLVWTHFFQCSKSKEAAEMVETIKARKASAAENASKLKSARLQAMSAFVGADEDDDGGAIGMFYTRYLGNVSVTEIQGDDVVRDAIHKLKDVIKEASGGSSSKASANRRSSSASAVARSPSDGPRRSSSAEAASAASAAVSSAEDGEIVLNVPALLVVSSEGIRVVDEDTRDVIANVVIKAISYSTEVVGKRLELFAFIEVDDRRNTKTCHVFMCEKGVKNAALRICEAVCKAFEDAVEDAKKRAGNPLLPMDKVRDVVEGPLASLQVPRKDLVAIKAIGAGQFGKVYLASGAPGEDQCAVKMLRSGASTADRTEFLSEAETMVHIGTHPNIVKLIGVAVQQRPWLVILEYCLYGDLSDVLKALGRRKIALTPAEQLSIARQLAEGLAFIALKGYVHMDFAARNVLVTEGSVMKIADFGLTHAYDEGKDYYKQLGVLKLSIRWLAIDSFDTKIFSEKADVWSWGITMWELYSYGLQPYRGYKLQEVLKMVRSGTRLEQPPGCPDEVFAVLETCWLKDRHARPTFNAIADTIRGIAAKLPDKGEGVRDIGQLLNADLKPRIQRASKRVKATAAGAPRSPTGADAPSLGPGAFTFDASAAKSAPAGAMDGEGLTGTVDANPLQTASVSKVELDEDL